MIAPSSCNWSKQQLEQVRIAARHYNQVWRQHSVQLWQAFVPQPCNFAIGQCHLRTAIGRRASWRQFDFSSFCRPHAYLPELLSKLQQLVLVQHLKYSCCSQPLRGARACVCSDFDGTYEVRANANLTYANKSLAKGRRRRTESRMPGMPAA